MQSIFTGRIKSWASRTKLSGFWNINWYKLICYFNSTPNTSKVFKISLEQILKIPSQRYQALCLMENGQRIMDIFPYKFGSEHFLSMMAQNMDTLIHLLPMNPFSTTLKTSENRKTFWCFMGVQKWCIGNKWFKKIPKSRYWIKFMFNTNFFPKTYLQQRETKILRFRTKFNSFMTGAVII